MLSKLLLIFNTVKHLKPRQLSGQVINRVRCRFEDPAKLLQMDVPDFKGIVWSEKIEILPPGMQLNTAEGICAGKMSFLNDEQQMGWMPNWDSKELPKLWLYNLHYFEWLWALDYKEAQAAILDWIENHPPAKGQQGWEPYPISLRLMNLCGVFWGKFKKQVEVEREFRGELWKSIYRQAEWLSSHLETHILGNHLFENGAALAFVGSCFRGAAAERWLSKGIEILREQVPEQIPGDGMHFELSPMYHSRMLYLMGILRATHNKRLVDLVNEPMRRMSDALKKLCHPDGQIALFNDSAFGIYNEPEQLLEYCSSFIGVVPPASSRLQSRQVIGNETSNLSGAEESESGVEATALQSAARNPINHQSSTIIPAAFSLPDAGYYGWRDDGGNYLICDYGKIGPDYQPGHAHADMLSYELSLNGHRVIVDGGVHDYEPSTERKYARSTAAHNTIEIDGQNQSEVWGTFRVARRACPQDVVFDASEEGFTLSGSHDGYKRVAGKPVHSREMVWDAGACCLKVADSVRSGCSVKAVSRIHLHPDCSISELGDQSIVVSSPVGRFSIAVTGDVAMTIIDGKYFPEFGVEMFNTVIELRVEGDAVQMNYEVKPCE